MKLGRSDRGGRRPTRPKPSPGELLRAPGVACPPPAPSLALGFPSEIKALVGLSTGMSPWHQQPEPASTWSVSSLGSTPLQPVHLVGDACHQVTTGW